MVYRLPIRWSDMVAIASGIVGTVLVLRPHFGQEVWGSMSAVASSLFASVAMMGLNRLGQLDARSVVVHFSALSSVLAVTAWLSLDGSWVEMRAVSSQTLTMLVFVGISGVLGQLMLTKAYGGGRAPTVAMAGMSQIAFGAIVDYLVFDHALDAWTLSGMTLILLPCMWELSHPLRRPSGVPIEVEEHANADHSISP
jgi:drug/metabolite transporter (DMT)-like permease